MGDFDDIRDISLIDITKGQGNLVMNGVEVKESFKEMAPIHLTRKQKKAFKKRHRKPEPITMSFTAEVNDDGWRKALESLIDDEICIRERRLLMKSSPFTKI